MARCGGLDGDLLVRREARHLSGRTDVRNPLPAESMLCLQQLISDALMLHGADGPKLARAFLFGRPAGSSGAAPSGLAQARQAVI